jgi:cytochrome P450
LESRWIDTDAERVKRIGQHILTFGAGKRTCLGNVAMLEIHKLVLALVMRYEIRLAEPDKEWKIRNLWIVRQDGVMSKRKQE